MLSQPVLILNDLIADFSLRIPSFPLNAMDLPKVEYIELGPGGATNIAIMGARFGLEITCLGEVGEDTFGKVVLEGLREEGVATDHIIVNPRARTPVAGVIVDANGEPAYLGYPGTLQLRHLEQSWLPLIENAAALYADGWVEYAAAYEMILDAFARARRANVPTFFDPGPGNPAVDSGWQHEAAARATVVLLNEQEGERLTGESDPHKIGAALSARGSELVIVKRGAAGCTLMRGDERVDSPGFHAELRDATGAGDSLSGAVIYGYLKGLPLYALGQLANATGAAKVKKLGTGHNMPTLPEIQAVLGANPLAIPTPA